MVEEIIYLIEVEYLPTRELVEAETVDAVPRSPGLQLANANSISFTGATFDGWWMNLGLGLAVGNTTLRLASRNASGESQRYKLRITDEPTLTGKYGLLVSS